MRGCVVGGLVCLSFIFASPVKASVEIGLSLKSQVSPEPLTTEKVWTLAPTQSDPHRQRWVLSSQLELSGLKVIQTGTRSKEVFKIESGELQGEVTGYLRGPGPWYQNLEHFPCGVDSHSDLASRFATEEGTRKGITEALDHWSKFLTQEKLKLSFALGHIRAETEQGTRDQARQVYRNWFQQLNRDWLAEQSKLKKIEWSHYEKAAHQAGLCGPSAKSKTHDSSTGPLPWKAQMEPIQGEPPKVTQVHVHAPARLWDGMFTIRVSVRMGDGSLNGRFLIDSTAPTSVVSPSWLEGQGILPALIGLTRVAPQKVLGSQFRENAGELSKWVSVERVEISGFPIPLNTFLLAETEFFGAPDHVGSCCDGVLGQDFLKLYPIEFQPQKPPEVRIWPKENFHWGTGGEEKGLPWIEVSSTEMASDCVSGSDTVGRGRLKGVRWNTGSPESLLLHTPWKKQGGAIASPSWKVECDSIQVARNATAVSPSELAAKRNPGLRQAFPAIDFGMELLSRGNFTFDLPHGRLWLASSGLASPPMARNRSGLKLKFEVQKKMGRILKVVSLKANSPAQSLAQAGLKPGMTITQLDGLEPADHDLWTLERHLAGEFGNTVTLQWQAQNGLKMAPMSLR